MGIRSMKNMNIAYIAKLGWRFLKEDESYWTKILRAKYTDNLPDINCIKPASRSSNSWKGINAALDIIKEGTQIAVRYGKDTRFWTDKWLIKTELLHLSTKVIPVDERNLTVRDYWDDESGWKFQKLNHLPPTGIINKLKGFFLSSDPNLKDTILWNQTSTGFFTVNSAYHLVSSHSNEQTDIDWKLIWSIRLPNRVNFFLWLIMHGRIMCNAERKRRHLTLVDDCHNCRGVSEDIDHVLRRCPMAKEVWKAIMPPQMFDHDLQMD
nr:putative non-LTR retroelement reverse transcriptase [Ipomoea batatas]